MKSWTRRKVLQSSIYAAGSFAFGSLIWRSRSGQPPDLTIPGQLLGPASAAGHKLRDGFHFPPPSEVRDTNVLILGGGIAGLSAGWRLQRRGIKDFRLLELENEVGGNSRSGQNSISKFPWGAHYVTVLNEEAKFATELFEDLGIITGWKNARPVYNEYFLCQAPHERLFILQKWQEGLVPKIGVPDHDAADAKAFFERVERLRQQKGRDGRYAFTIPLNLSSTDSEYRDLDRISMQQYLRQNGWNSKSLQWYVNYCCRDDYGTPYNETSAWAGMHYYCSRRGRADGAEGSTVLTWPEGNGWIVDKLRSRLQSSISTDAMGIHIQQSSQGVTVNTWSETTQKVTQWNAKSLILAVPRFVADRLVTPSGGQVRIDKDAMSYAPWLVASVTLRAQPSSGAGVPQAWDNVFYDSRSLGYVVATHQRPSIHAGASVWTYYRPLDHLPPSEARKEARAKTAEQWKREVIEDLQLAHPQIDQLIDGIDVWTWGHAMVRPTPGFIWGASRREMQRSAGRIHYAHSDMSGLSIFEEANYHGVRAADEAIEHDLG